MKYSAKVILDSLIPYKNSYVRVTTVEVTFPRIVLAEQNTHRNQSRNTSSSRAIPSKRLRRDFCSFEPHRFPKNGKGMQPSKFFRRGSFYDIVARFLWRTAKYVMFFISWLLNVIGVHKQITNRLLEPFMWTTMIITASKWNNYFTLRVHKDAQLELRLAAYLIKRAIRQSVPKKRHLHLPFLDFEEYVILSMFDNKIDSGSRLSRNEANKIYSLVKSSVARIARGSYLNQHKKSELLSDFQLYHKLVESKPVHASPTESVVFSHKAFQVLKKQLPSFNVKFIYGSGGNLGDGVVQFRKIIEDQSVQN